MANDAEQTLEAGRRILAAIVELHGFKWCLGSSGPGSGGAFACGEYVRDDRKLELHYRHSLGLVTYHIGEASVAHADYMRVVLGEGGGNEYPGFSSEPLDAFRHLAHDLEHHCDAFLRGPDQDFKAIAQQVAVTAKKRRLP